MSLLTESGHYENGHFCSPANRFGKSGQHVRSSGPRARQRVLRSVQYSRSDLMAPMGNASPTSLAIAVANAGGLAGCGAVGDATRCDQSLDGGRARAGSNGVFQLNLWHPRSSSQTRPDRRGRRPAISAKLGSGVSRPRPAISRCRTSPRSAKPCWRRDHRSFHRSWDFTRTTSCRA